MNVRRGDPIPGWAVVTGGSRGLGLAMASRLSQDGYPVVVVARSAKTLDEARRTLGHSGEPIETVVVDLRDPDAGSRMIRDIETGLGPIGVLVNNAGIFERGFLRDTDAAQWTRLSNVNVVSALEATRSMAEYMKARGVGRIINVASTAGLVGVEGALAYAMTKASIVAMTRVVALELARSGVTVNAVAPGMFATDMTDDFRADPDTEKWALERSPMRRWGKSEELADVVSMLASQGSSFVTGQIIAVDGGWTAR